MAKAIERMMSRLDEELPNGNGTATTPAFERRSMATVQEVARFLKVTERSVYNWALNGKLRGHKVGEVWRFYWSDVDAFVKAGAPECAPEEKE